MFIEDEKIHFIANIFCSIVYIFASLIWTSLSSGIDFEKADDEHLCWVLDSLVADLGQTDEGLFKAATCLIRLPCHWLLQNCRQVGSSISWGLLWDGKLHNISRVQLNFYLCHSESISIDQFFGRLCTVKIWQDYSLQWLPCHLPNIRGKCLLHPCLFKFISYFHF